MVGVTVARKDRVKTSSRKSLSLNVERFLQPDETTCGPTCLRRVYSLFGLNDKLEDIIDALERNEDDAHLQDAHDARICISSRRSRSECRKVVPDGARVHRIARRCTLPSMDVAIAAFTKNALHFLTNELLAGRLALPNEVCW